MEVGIHTWTLVELTSMPNLHGSKNASMDVNHGSESTSIEISTEVSVLA